MPVIVADAQKHSSMEVHFPFVTRSAASRFLLAVVVSGGMLSACSLTPHPTPDTTLTRLAARASAEAKTFDSSDSPYAALRRADLAELRTEIQRVCGHKNDGTLPSSCDDSALDSAIEKAHLDVDNNSNPADAATIAAQEIVSSAGELPEGSMLLAANQLVDLVSAGAAAPTTGGALFDPSVNKKLKSSDVKVDADAARDALAWEYSIVYGLGVATASASGLLKQAVNDSIDAHQNRISILQSSLAPTGNFPKPESAYELKKYQQPFDAQSTADYIEALRKDTTDYWIATAATAKTTSWKELALAFAAQTAVGAPTAPANVLPAR
ncbi:DUF4439 domain-containing protein [Corynebacterium ulcerans]|uniref:Secreted protein n=3 Tax=Bacteria TaxID=2 RepID=A0ABD7MRA5_CORUL|nr:DUF4439 domain-containing protein [Corynebacterium ulcerans]AKN77282.1 Hypothetical protein CulFRC58_1428 [Corynebacterium ulcerans FRC58]AIU30685.1 Hypothetical protein Cul210931_1349 [Corynebacterium ulcerans]MDK8887940.1 DUF4439 domain-containing protein [Corynebacterium ulcerans]SNV04741.1 putative secreted protein [Corynebacterium ulcerans]SQG50347.1 putative secreted protein [Corynebacterium ulcerans]